jgi:hypothetical protein
MARQFDVAGSAIESRSRAGTAIRNTLQQINVVLAMALLGLLATWIPA